MMHAGCTAHWWALKPNIEGSYIRDTWTRLADMPSGYEPLYFASAVLRDGRVLVNGGEYIACNQVMSNRGALYDPLIDTWTNVKPPSAWITIGNAQSVVLANGHYMVANPETMAQAIAKVAARPSQKVTWSATGSGKADENDEEGWTLLPDTRVLTERHRLHAGSSQGPIASPKVRSRCDQIGDRAENRL